MSDPAFHAERAVVKRFKDHGLHPQQVTTWPDSSIWVLVPPWEIKDAKRLAERIAEVRELHLQVFPLPHPQQKGK